MFELESLPDLLKPCGLVYPRQEDQYAQLLQDILVTKSDILPHSQEVGLYESVGNVIQVENITPVTPPFTIETLLTSDQYLGNYSGLHQQHETGSLSKLSELEIQQLLCSLTPVSQTEDQGHKVRSSEELSRLLTPIIEDCVKRNIEGLLSTLTERLSQRTQISSEFDSNEVDQQNINENCQTSSASTDSEAGLPLEEPQSSGRRRARPGSEVVSHQLAATLHSLGLGDTDQVGAWQHLGSGISLQDFYIGLSHSHSTPD